MKFIKGIIAVSLALIMVFSLAACHKKGEVAITVGGVEITSGLYSYYLVEADGEAKQIIDDSEDYDSTVEGFDYLKTTIEGVSFEEYVKNLALSKCKEYAAYEKKMAEAGTKLGSEEENAAKNMVDFYWETYGFQYIYEENGVGYDTYLKATIHQSKKSQYFEDLYGEGGDREIPTEDYQKAVDEHYAAIYYLDATWGSSTEDTEDKAKEKLQAYLDRLNKGEEFSKLYEEYNADSSSSSSESASSSSSSTSTSSDASSGTSSTSSADTSSGSTSSEDDTPKPKDQLIAIVGDDKTGYEFDFFSDIKAMKTDEAKLISDTENKTVYLIVKKDINSDTYYRDTMLTTDIMSVLKEDDFTKEMKDYANSLDCQVNKYAINQFKVKNIYDGTN